MIEMGLRALLEREASPAQRFWPGELREVSGGADVYILVDTRSRRYVAKPRRQRLGDLIDDVAEVDAPVRPRQLVLGGEGCGRGGDMFAR